MHSTPLIFWHCSTVVYLNSLPWWVLWLFHSFAITKTPTSSKSCRVSIALNVGSGLFFFFFKLMCWIITEDVGWGPEVSWAQELLSLILLGAPMPCSSPRTPRIREKQEATLSLREEEGQWWREKAVRWARGWGFFCNLALLAWPFHTGSDLLGPGRAPNPEGGKWRS